MSTTVEKIKERLGIVEVVSSYIKLNKAGRNYKAKSPFVTERTPSFFVAPDKNLYHCFSSGKGGDIFTFVQEMEGVDFYTALKMLADRAGVEIEQVDRKKETELSTLYKIMEEATDFYQEELKKNEKVIKYLKDRGVNDDSIKKFEIGFAPAGWNHLYDHLKKKGFLDNLIEKTGLTVMGRQGYYDRFRGRIMFPISDSQGRAVAFSGRVFEDPDHPFTEEEKEKQGGKYVNSPEGVLYNKSKILYGYDKAKQSIMREDACIVVEGQMDVVMSYQAGIENTVAISGTALTDDHVKLLGRFTDRIILALDSDRAGIAASGRSVKVAFQNGLEVLVARLRGGKDPADIAKENPEELKNILSQPEEYVKFRLETLAESKENERKNKKIIEEELFPYISDMVSAIDQDQAIKKISDFLRVSGEAVRQDFERWEERNKDQGSRSKEQQEEEEPIPKTGSLLAGPSIQTLLGIVLWQDAIPGSKVKKEVYTDQLKAIIGAGWAEKALAAAMAKKDILLFEAEMRYGNVAPEKITGVLEEYLGTIELQALDLRLTHTLEKLRTAEEAKNEEVASQLLGECNTISKKISAIKEKYFI